MGIRGVFLYEFVIVSNVEYGPRIAFCWLFLAGSVFFGSDFRVYKHGIFRGCN
jgi:hypothetical protein